MVRRLLVAFTAALLLAPAAAYARAPFQTGVVEPNVYYGPADQVLTAFEHTKAAGAHYARIYVSWAAIAPTQPAAGQAANPGNPGYNFSQTDIQARMARAAGLEPIFDLTNAPAWAERGRHGQYPQYPWEVSGTLNPDPAAFGAFAQAIAARYSGNYGGLPRVRYWQIWNEPNYWYYFSPQYSGQEPPGNASYTAPQPSGAVPVSPGLYLSLLNSAAHSIHSVSRDNMIITGGLSPFGHDLLMQPVIAPLQFMRQMLCMDAHDKPLAGCAQADFDIWSQHPYTDGSPEHAALVAGDVSIPELPEVHRLLNAAARAHHISAGRRVQLWVTEISWTTNPPSPGGVPETLQARWVSEALYRMWRAGVSMATWFMLRDSTPPTRKNSPVFQSGLYFRCAAGVACDTPKLAFTAFRFPFVAYRAGRKRARVWGRTPSSRKARVFIEQAVGSRWRRIATLRADGNGIFTKVVKLRGGGNLRARIPGSPSLPFSLVPPPDRTVNPFG